MNLSTFISKNYVLIFMLVVIISGFLVFSSAFEFLFNSYKSIFEIESINLKVESINYMKGVYINNEYVLPDVYNKELGTDLYSSLKLDDHVVKIEQNDTVYIYDISEKLVFWFVY